MTEGMQTIIYPVTDLAGAKASVRRAAGRRAVHGPAVLRRLPRRRPGYRTRPNGHSKGMTGPVGYWHVDDIKRSLQALLDAGAEAQQSGQRCRWRQADRIGQGRRRQHHRAHSVALTGRRRLDLPAHDRVGHAGDAGHRPHVVDADDVGAAGDAERDRRRRALDALVRRQPAQQRGRSNDLRDEPSSSGRPSDAELAQAADDLDVLAQPLAEADAGVDDDLRRVDAGRARQSQALRSQASTSATRSSP